MVCFLFHQFIQNFSVIFLNILIVGSSQDDDNHDNYNHDHSDDVDDNDCRQWFVIVGDDDDDDIGHTGHLRSQQEALERLQAPGGGGGGGEALLMPQGHQEGRHLPAARLLLRQQLGLPGHGGRDYDGWCKEDGNLCWLLWH